MRRVVMRRKAVASVSMVAAASCAVKALHCEITTVFCHCEMKIIRSVMKGSIFWLENYIGIKVCEDVVQECFEAHCPSSTTSHH